MKGYFKDFHKNEVFLFGIFSLTFFFCMSDKGFYFPEEDELIFSEFSVYSVGYGYKSGGLKLDLVDANGDFFIADGGNMASQSNAYDFIKKASSENLKINVGWYSNCLFEYIDIRKPCIVEVVIEHEGETYLTYEESRNNFYNKSYRAKLFSKYLNLFISVIIFLISFIYQFYRKDWLKLYE